VQLRRLATQLEKIEVDAERIDRDRFQIDRETASLCEVEPPRARRRFAG